MGATGFQLPQDFSGNTLNCGKSAAGSGAVSPQFTVGLTIDRVQFLAEALRELSPEDRARLAALLTAEKVEGMDG
jgi:hypothetical protein